MRIGLLVVIVSLVGVVGCSQEEEKKLPKGYGQYTVDEAARSSSLAPTPTPTATAVPTPTPTPTATAAPKPTDTPPVTPGAPTATPTPMATNTPSVPPEQQLKDCKQKLEQLEPEIKQREKDLNAATKEKETFIANSKKSLVCSACKGVGYSVRNNAGREVRVPCNACNGTGRVPMHPSVVEEKMKELDEKIEQFKSELARLKAEHDANEELQKKLLDQINSNK